LLQIAMLNNIFFKRKLIIKLTVTNSSINWLDYTMKSS